MINENDLTAEERQVIAVVANESDEMLLELLGQLDVQESSTSRLSPPGRDELRELGQTRLDAMRSGFCQLLRNNQLAKSLFENDDRITFLEKLHTIIVAMRGHTETIDLVIYGILAARHGVSVFCNGVDSIEKNL